MCFMYQSCTNAPSIDISNEALIPVPSKVEATNSSFQLTSSTTLNLIGDEKELTPLAKFFNNRISKSTGFELKVSSKSGVSKGINFVINNESKNGPEAYYLEISENQIMISATAPVGIFYGIQTLIQLMPDAIENGTLQERDWFIGTGIISDSPEYAYRGVMLDVARHFFSIEDVKKYIDYIAAYKMNGLHLHLSDDQGWRIEIKSWPELTNIGGKTQVGGGKGGFYTQEQYKEIVAYAAENFVTVIPEIDMPGHTNAALASYAELNCDNKARELYTGIEVGFSTLCTDKEVTYQFVDDVIKELAEMTPGEYIHIGGDESHATAKEDYIPFMNRVQEIVLKHGKKVMAWDELSISNIIDTNVVVQFWDSAENAKMGVSKGAKVLMSPAKKAYLDMQYDSTSPLGLHWAAYIEVDDAYNWEPMTYVNDLNKEDIFGIETALWSETVTNLDEIEYMMFPRVTAIGEIAWSKAENRSWESYSNRLAKHGKRMKNKGINYYESAKIKWEVDAVKENPIKG